MSTQFKIEVSKFSFRKAVELRTIVVDFKAPDSKNHEVPGALNDGFVFLSSMCVAPGREIIRFVRWVPRP